MITSEEEARRFVAERCSPASFEAIERFIERLVEENTRQNLVAAKSIDAIWQRHIADSAQLLDHVPRETGMWLDLGTGAGFPGLVIALMRPQLRVVLVESRRRRIDWLEGARATFGLQNCRVEGCRLELLDSFPADIISARAFAPLQKTVRLANRFSTSDTWWLLPKGRSAAQEVAELPQSLKTMFHVEHSATDPESGIVVGRIIESQRR